MRLEMIGKTKSILEDVDVQSQKMGQTDIKPAVCLHFKVPMPNSCLHMFDKSALQFLYTKNGSAAKQQTLEGVNVISEFSQLTDAAIALGPFSWDGEQTGSTLVIHRGIKEEPYITLRDGTTNKYKTVHHEGGTVDVYFRFFTTDLDAETLGELAVLKSHDIEIELTAPEAISSKQKTIDEADAAATGTSSKVTRIKAGKNDPAMLTPEQALAEAHKVR
jgi:hypothetical protein